MVDVVFMLLAYFVLTSAIIPQEQDFAASTARAGEGGSVVESLIPSVEVRLTAVGDGVAISLGPARTSIDSYEALTAALDTLALDKSQVILVPGADVPVDAVMRAADAVLTSRMSDLSIARLERSP
jgi:biopolymer transport protein ExbD